MKKQVSTTLDADILQPVDTVHYALYCVYSPQSSLVGQQFLLAPDRSLMLGRDMDASDALSIEDPRISHRHATITVTPDHLAYRIEDCGSRNGTFLNGARIDNDFLVPNCILRVGGTLFVMDRQTPLVLDSPGRHGNEDAIIGHSPAMVDLLDQIERVASTALTVLIVGETGVGKEIVARNLHIHSRRSGELVAVNMAALPEALVEAELFGHAKGAFSGATGTRQGLFEAANRGTLFLDEIGDLPLGLQAKLLRAIETRHVRRVGEDRERPVDVRIVAATNANLRTEVQAKRYRADLLARLLEFEICIPPLRERRVDILSLFEHFMTLATPARPVPTLTAELAEALLVFDWPFNVRELRHLAFRLATLDTRGTLDIHVLPPALRQPVLDRMSPNDQLPAPQLLGNQAPTCEELRRTLLQHGGNIAQVALYFGKGRQQIYRWLHYHNLDPGDFRPS